MPAPHVPSILQFPRQHSVDDVYSAWSNAQRRCTEALRAWRAAGSGARAAAYRTYVDELDFEELAAAELARSHRLRTAA